MRIWIYGHMDMGGTKSGAARVAPAAPPPTALHYCTAYWHLHLMSDHYTKCGNPLLADLEHKHFIDWLLFL